MIWWKKLKILVTGGAGFIGSAVARHAIAAGPNVPTMDKLTHAGRKEALDVVLTSPQHRFADNAAVAEAFSAFGNWTP